MTIQKACYAGLAFAWEEFQEWRQILCAYNFAR